MYLTAITDWHSRFEVDWALSDTLEAAPVLQGISGGSRHPPKHGGKGRWVDNVIIERWFRSLKCDYIYICEYASPCELRVGIRGHVDDYNSLRPHQSLGYEMPETAYVQAFAAIAG